jgi:hypothetical protein
MPLDEISAICTIPAESLLMWVGILIFWLVIFIVVMITFCVHNGSKSDWYRRVFLYGAYELADIVANRSDELRNEDGSSSGPQPCWKPIFVFWWAFSIKYFIPWALFTLMMWNFKADITLSGGYGYGGYNDMWQAVGFIYPLIGLICFFVPICIVTTPEDYLAEKDADGNIIGRKELDLEHEEHKVLREQEEEYKKNLRAAREATGAK